MFDHHDGRLIRTAEFGDDADSALAAYAATESEFSERNEIEVVLVGSDSLETVKRTHTKYFGGSASVSKYLAGI